MRRYLTIGTSVLLVGIGLEAATLLKLSLEDMIQKSTSIVRGRITGSYVQPAGSIIYTHYTVQVAEEWKGSGAASVDVVVPGGASGGLRQTFEGAPRPVVGGDYVLFLWKSRAGLTHIIGLSQGLLSLKRNASGELVASRAPGGDTVLDASGHIVRDQGFSMRLNDLRARVGSGVAGGRK